MFFIGSWKKHSTTNPLSLQHRVNQLPLIGLAYQSDHPVDLKKYLAKCQEYHHGTGYLKTLEKRYAPKPHDTLGRMIKAGYLITGAKSGIARFEDNVRILLYLKETITFDTECLRTVRTHIDAAAFSKANAALDIGYLDSEQESLLQIKTGNMPDTADAGSRLASNANAFLLKALLGELDSLHRDYRCSSHDLLKKTIRSNPSPENLFEYCFRYQKHCGGCEPAPEYLKLITECPDPRYRHFVAAAMYNLFVMYIDSRQFEKAEEQFRIALSYFRSHIREDTDIFTPCLAATLAGMATVRLKKEDYQKAFEISQESISLYRTCARTDPERHCPALARTLSTGADIQKFRNNLPASVKLFSESAEIFRALSKKDPETYRLALVDTLAAYAGVLEKSEKYVSARGILSEAVTECNLLIIQDPGTYLEKRTVLLRSHALLCAVTNDFSRSEAELQNVLFLYRQMRKIPRWTRICTLELCKTLGFLGCISSSIQKNNLAKRELLRAYSLFQSLADNPLFILEMTPTLMHLSRFYDKNLPDRDKSIFFASLALYVIRPVSTISQPANRMYLDARDQLSSLGIFEKQVEQILGDTELVKKLKTLYPHLYP